MSRGQPDYQILAPVPGRFVSTPTRDADWRRGRKPRPGETMRTKMLGVRPRLRLGCLLDHRLPHPQPPATQAAAETGAAATGRSAAAGGPCNCRSGCGAGRQGHLRGRAENRSAPRPASRTRHRQTARHHPPRGRSPSHEPPQQEPQHQPEQGVGGVGGGVGEAFPPDPPRHPLQTVRTAIRHDLGHDRHHHHRPARREWDIAVLHHPHLGHRPAYPDPERRTPDHRMDPLFVNETWTRIRTGFLAR